MSHPEQASVQSEHLSSTGSAGQGRESPVLAEKFIHKFLDLIRKGVLQPGQKLPAERELAESMGIGRPSLREALRALSLLGILDIRHREGIFVSDFEAASLLHPLQFYLSLNAQSLDALFESRIVIEPGIAEIAARKIDEDGLAALRACNSRGARTLTDPEAFQKVDEEFHQLIVEVTGNPFLQRVSQSYRELGKASRQITGRLPSILRQSHQDHDKILDALERRDSQAAKAAMEEHLHNVQAAYHFSKINLRPDQEAG